MADSTNILPSIPELNIHKSSAISYQQKSLSELFTLGETELDQKFAERLEIKREIIGLSYNDIAHMLNQSLRLVFQTSIFPPRDGTE